MVYLVVVHPWHLSEGGEADGEARHVHGELPVGDTWMARREAPLQTVSSHLLEIQPS